LEVTPSTSVYGKGGVWSLLLGAKVLRSHAKRCPDIVQMRQRPLVWTTEGACSCPFLRDRSQLLPDKDGIWAFGTCIAKQREAAKPAATMGRKLVAERPGRQWALHADRGKRAALPSGVLAPLANTSPIIVCWSHSAAASGTCRPAWFNESTAGSPASCSQIAATVRMAAR